MRVHRRNSSFLPGRSWMDGPENSFVITLFYRLGLLAALFGLFFPIFGPALDHHFVERQHNHAHVYLLPRELEHVHFYEDAHSHSHAQAEPDSPSSALPTQDSGVADVIYLTANDGVGQTVTSLAATTLHVDVVYPVLGDNQFLLGFSGQDTYPPEALIPPPERPPQV